MIKNMGLVLISGLMEEDTKDNGKKIFQIIRGNGKQHGKGKYYLLDGSVKTGVWEDGKRIKWVVEEEK